MDSEIVFLALAAPAAFIVSLATVSGMVGFAQQAGSSPTIAKLYSAVIQAALLGILVPILANIFTEQSNKALIIGTFAFLIGAPLAVIFLVSAAKKEMPRALNLAGWICGFLLIVIVVVRYQLRH